MADSTVTIPISLGPQFSSGEPSLIPEGFCARVRNLLLRPKRLDTRPPFVYDNLMNVRGLANFDDTTNKVSRMIAINSSQAFFEKATSGETFSASLGTLTGTRLTSLTNYRGKAYGMMETNGLPAAAFSFDGTNINTAPFNSSIQGRVGIAYLDRFFILYPRVVVSNQLPAVADAYMTTWGLLNVTRLAATDGTRTTVRLAPTTTNITVSIGRTNVTGPTLAASPVDRLMLFAYQFQAIDQTYDLPLTLIVTVLGKTHADTTAYAVGDFVTASSLVWRATVAGTSAGPHAALVGDIGTTVVDGGVTWVAERSANLALKIITVPSAADFSDWSTTHLDGIIPWSNHTVTYGANIYWGRATFDSAGTPTIDADLPEIIAVNVAYKDGIADGDPRKKTHGFQATLGDFRYPFFNQESGLTATVDMNSVVWSEILQPASIRASATYELWEVPGYPTAGTLLGGRLLAFKRSAFWIFAGNTDQTSFDVIPIRREDKKEGVGCIGPKALDALDNDLHFIGEDGVYHFTLGGDPEEIGGDAMREEIIARGANWVESQATYNMPILRVNPRDREVYVYTQKGTIYVYNIARKGWTTIDVTVGGVALEVADMIFNPNTRKMYVAFGGYGLARLDWSSAPANDTIDNTANTYPVTKDLVTRPIEAFSPRQDGTVDNIGAFHLATAQQTGQELTAHVSFDRGATYPFHDKVTLDITTPRNQIDIFESEPSITIKLSHVGKAGKEVWSISKMDAEIIPQGGEWPQTKPAPVSANL